MNEGKYFAGVCFVLKGDLVQRIQDSNRFELMRFAVFKEIEEYLEENRNGFVTKRSENSSTIILVLYSTDLQNETETIISRIREIVYGKYGVELIAGIGTDNGEWCGLSVRLWFGKTEFSAETGTAPVPGTGAGDREAAEEVFSGNDIFRISDPEWRDGGRLPDL